MDDILDCHRVQYKGVWVVLLTFIESSIKGVVGIVDFHRVQYKGDVNSIVSCHRV